MEIGLGKNDALLGRGAFKHFGNVFLRHLVAQNSAKYYTKSCNKDKDLIIGEIMGTEKKKNLNPPGRFICRAKKTNKWEEVEDITSRQKLVQTFRDFRYAVIKKANAQNNPSAIFHLFDLNFKKIVF